MNIAHWLYQSAKTWPGRTAIYLGDMPIATYGELALRVQARASKLRDEHGVELGDRVGIYAPNCVEYLEVLYAVLWLGAVVVPINFKLHAKEAAWIAENADVKVLHNGVNNPLPVRSSVCVLPMHDGQIQAAGTLHAPLLVEPDALAWLFYTSGTTGRPKGAMLSHSNLIHMSLCYGFDIDNARQQDVALYAAPISHGAGMYNFVFTRIGAAHLVPESQGFKEQEIINLAAAVGNLTFFAAPTMVKRLVSRARHVGFDGAGIRTIVYGGGPMYLADLEDALEQFGPRLAQVYGQGESPMTITAMSRLMVSDTSHPNWQNRRKAVGVAHSCVEVSVVDVHGASVPPGECGEVVVRGPTVMLGYWRDEQATRRTVVDNWLYTGDLGYMDDDGFLTLTDRSKDVIISGGTNIYPREVEEVLQSHPGILEVSVIGVPDDEWGESVTAVVVRSEGSCCSERELKKYCQDNLASFKKPKNILFLETLPKNSYGKVLKTELREVLLEQ